MTLSVWGNEEMQWKENKVMKNSVSEFWSEIKLEIDKFNALSIWGKKNKGDKIWKSQVLGRNYENEMNLKQFSYIWKVLVITNQKSIMSVLETTLKYENVHSKSNWSSSKFKSQLIMLLWQRTSHLL